MGAMLGMGWLLAASLLGALAQSAAEVEIAFRLEQRDLVPEGIAYDPVDDRFFIGSTYRRKVVAVEPDGAAHDFVSAGRTGLFGVVGMAVDAERRVLWVASAASSGMPARGLRPSADGASGLAAYGLPDGELLAHFLLSDSSFLNDVAVGPDGAAYVTDSERGVVFSARVGDEAMAVALDLGDAGSPNGLDWSADGEVLYVAAGHELYAWTPGEPPRHLAREDDGKSVIDGIDHHRGRIYAVQPFARGAQVVAVDVEAPADGVRDNRVVLPDHATLSQPTTLARRGGELHLLANSHLQVFRRMVAGGRLADTVALSAPVVLRIGSGELDGDPAANPDHAGPGARLGHIAAYDPGRETLLLFGGAGRDADPGYRDLWALRRGAWERVSASGPRARALPAGAFDTRRGALVVHGGIGGAQGTRWADTWEFDGARWREATAPGPGPLDHHAMAYDPARGRAVVFGGQGWDRSFVGSTWEWDGATWTELEAPGPAPRVHHAMTYDPEAGAVLVFGGADEEGVLLSDLWAWDGSAWRLLSDGETEPRARHRMAYDERRRRLVVSGGNGPHADEGFGFRVLDRVDAWDGERWSEGPALPEPRFMHAMVYDAATGSLVVLGGRGPESREPVHWVWNGEGGWRWAGLSP